MIDDGPGRDLRPPAGSEAENAENAHATDQPPDVRANQEQRCKAEGDLGLDHRQCPADPGGNRPALSEEDHRLGDQSHADDGKLSERERIPIAGNGCCERGCDGGDCRAGGGLEPAPCVEPNDHQARHGEALDHHPPLHASLRLEKGREEGKRIRGIDAVQPQAAGICLENVTGVDAAPKQRILAEPLPHVDVSTAPGVSGPDDQDENPVGDQRGREDPQAGASATDPP